MSHGRRAAGTASRSPRAPARASQMCQFPVTPSQRWDGGAEPCPGLTGSSWQRWTSDFELPLPEVIKKLGGGCVTHSPAHWPGAMVCSCSWCVPARTPLPSPAVNRLVCKRLLPRRGKVKALQPPTH